MNHPAIDKLLMSLPIDAPYSPKDCYGFAVEAENELRLLLANEKKLEARVKELEAVVQKLSSKFNTQEESIDFLKNAVYQHGKEIK